MKFAFLLSLSGLILAFFLSVLNLFSGFELSRSPSLDSQYHLVRAILMLILGLTASAGLIYTSQGLVDRISKAIILAGKEIPPDLIRSRSTAIPGTISIILLCVLSMVSGSLANAGRFPILHALLGFGLCINFLIGFIFWIIFWFNQLRYRA